MEQTPEFVTQWENVICRLHETVYGLSNLMLGFVDLLMQFSNLD